MGLSATSCGPSIVPLRTSPHVPWPASTVYRLVWYGLPTVPGAVSPMWVLISGPPWSDPAAAVRGHTPPPVVMILPTGPADGTCPIKPWSSRWLKSGRTAAGPVAPFLPDGSKPLPANARSRSAYSKTGRAETCHSRAWFKLFLTLYPQMLILPAVPRCGRVCHWRFKYPPIDKPCRLGARRTFL